MDKEWNSIFKNIFFSLFQFKIAEAGTLFERIKRHFGPVKAKMRLPVLKRVTQNGRRMYKRNLIFVQNIQSVLNNLVMHPMRALVIPMG